MDRQAWIAITLCVLGLIGWQVYMTKTALPVAARSSVVAAASPAPENSSAPNSSPAATPADIAAAPATSPAPVATPSFAEKFEVLANPDIELRLTNRGGGISEARMLHQAGADGKTDVVLNAPSRLPIGAFLEQPTSASFREFTPTRLPDGSIQYDRVTPEGVTVRKHFFFPPPTAAKDNFVVEMQVEIRNGGAATYKSPDYFVGLGSSVPIHLRDLPTYTRMVWFVGGKARSTDVTQFSAQHYPLVGIERRPEQKVFQEKVGGAEWGAMSNQFFTSIVTPMDGKISEVWAIPFELTDADGAPLKGIEGAIGFSGFALEPGQSLTQNFQIYAGPKLYARLAKLPHDEAAIMNFGLWRPVSQTLLNFMNLLHSWVKSYGLAIILLTACVKGVLWPLQNKANKSMRRMSALSPKMQALKEKYKDDPTKMNTEVMKLYKEHGVNPVGGCLPMMIQIPIFFGLFTMLGQAAELRNASFLWIHDLSQPDTIAHIPGLDWKVNLLPILMGASNVWLMRMTPNTGDAMQRRVMMFMPLIFLVFCYNFAAALALYYTTQNLFTILQLWQNKKQPAPVLTTPTPIGKRGRKGKS